MKQMKVNRIESLKRMFLNRKYLLILNISWKKRGCCFLNSFDMGNMIDKRLRNGEIQFYRNLVLISPLDCDYRNFFYRKLCFILCSKISASK